MSRINIVTGPPGAGKNTYINQHFCNGDILIDLDAIYLCLSQNTSHCEKDLELLNFSLDVRRFLYDYVRRYIKDKNVWIVACMPNGRKREMLARTFRDATVYLLNPGKETCIKHIEQDINRTYSSEYALKIVEDWYKKYSPSRNDRAVSLDD